MIGMVRDTWRAVLVLVVGFVLIEVCRRPPIVGTYASAPAPMQAPMQYQQPAPVAHAQFPAWPGTVPAPTVITVASQPEQPLRRMAESVIALGDSVLGVIR